MVSISNKVAIVRSNPDKQRSVGSLICPSCGKRTRHQKAQNSLAYEETIVLPW